MVPAKSSIDRRNANAFPKKYCLKHIFLENSAENMFTSNPD